MIRSYKIKESKDFYGRYILPLQLNKRKSLYDTQLYNSLVSYKYLLFAIICIVYPSKKEKTKINHWSTLGISINSVFLSFEKYYLDNDNNVIYEMNKPKDEIHLVERILKLKKLKNDILYI